MATIIDPPNSVWPNGLKVDSEGYAIFYPLGTNKVDISTITWPDGYKLISPYVYDENDKIVGFVDSTSLAVSDFTSTTMDYEYIDVDFASIPEHKLTVNTPNAKTKKIKWLNLTRFEDMKEKIRAMFRSAYKVIGNKLYDKDSQLIGEFNVSSISTGTNVIDIETGETSDGKAQDALYLNLNTDTGESKGYIISEFTSDLSNLTYGYQMFWGCSDLVTFNTDLSSLGNGSSMFYNCSSLSSFNSNLSRLDDGGDMFYACSSLTAFDSDLSRLTFGRYMFAECTNLTSFSSNLSNLTNGRYMFYNCRGLTSFSSDLSNLTDCYNIFYGCKLDATSVKNIIDTINTYEGTLRLGMGCDDTEEDKDLFAQEAGYNDMASLLAALQNKGWTVTAQYNGRPTATYSLRRTVVNTLPVFVKLEEAEEHADYTSIDGSKKFILDYFHETTGSTEGYTQFNSLDEAIETLNIKPIERNR